MAALSAFYPEIELQVPSAPRPVIDHAIRNACIEFADRSKILQVTTDPQDLAANVADYDLDLPPGTQLVKVMNAWINDEPPLSILTPEQVYEADALYGTGTPGTPRAAFVRTPESSILTLAPRPGANATAALRVRLSYKPSRTASAVDDTLFNNWYEDICAGALARLRMIPNKVWSNPTQAGIDRQVFMAGVSRAVAQAMTSGAVTQGIVIGPRIIWSKR
jgi:hypothetical protein